MTKNEHDRKRYVRCKLNLDAGYARVTPKGNLIFRDLIAQNPLMAADILKDLSLEFSRLYKEAVIAYAKRLKEQVADAALKGGAR